MSQKLGLEIALSEGSVDVDEASLSEDEELPFVSLVFPDSDKDDDDDDESYVPSSSEAEGSASEYTSLASEENDDDGVRIRGTERASVIRIDFNDDRAWEIIKRRVSSPSPSYCFLDDVDFIDNRAFSVEEGEDVVENLIDAGALTNAYTFIADTLSMEHEDHPLLAVTLISVDDDGCEEIATEASEAITFRVVAHALQAVYSSLATCKADFDDYWTGGDIDDEDEWYREGILSHVIKNFDDGVYVGNICEHKPHGRGTFFYANGDIYDGDFVNGEWSGVGYLRRGSLGHNFYYGEFVGGKRNGKGKYVSKLYATAYEGQWNADQMHGRGTLNLEDGRVYEGEFAEGVICGEGKMSYPHIKDLALSMDKLIPTSDIFAGRFANGQRDGHGILTCVNGNMYDGEWKADQKHGLVTCFLQDEYYFGHFDQDKRVAPGTCISNEIDEAVVSYIENGKVLHVIRYAGGDIYVGDLDDSRFPHGRGKMAYFEGVAGATGEYITSYDGEWVRGARSGSGTITYTDGSKFTGNWVDGERMDGEGVIVMASGNRYSGEFAKGKFHGAGSYYVKDGHRTATGTWLDGEIVGDASVVDSSGNKYVGGWCTECSYSGPGIMIYPDGNSLQGTFDTGKPVGKGIFTWANGDVYEGEFQAGIMYGSGVLKYKSGDEFEGRFVLGRRVDGDGILRFADKRIYVGGFVDEFMHGKGVLYEKGGIVFEGNFMRGKKQGDGTYTLPNGAKISGHHKDGLLADPVAQHLIDQESLLASMDDAKLGCLPTNIPYKWLEEWTSDFSVILGSGNFGTVYEGVVPLVGSGEKGAGVGFRRMAVKKLVPELILRGDEVDDRADVMDFLKSMKREIRVLTSFHHPNIIRLIGYHLPGDVHLGLTTNMEPDSEVELGTAAPSTRHLCLVYELASKGSLDMILKCDVKASKFDWRRRMRTSLDIASAINYMHCHYEGHPALHRDVKSANIALDGESYTGKLIDCGLSKYHRHFRDIVDVSTSGSKVTVGTHVYADPRAMYEGYSSRSDMYSYGIVLLELLFGKLQGSAAEMNGKIRNLNLRDRRFLKTAELDARAGSWETTCAETLRRVAIKCTEEDSEDRYEGMHEVIRELRGVESLFNSITDAERRAIEEVAALTEIVEFHRLKRILDERNDAEKAKLLQRSCCVCYDVFAVSDGLECRVTESPHFMCADCLDGSVRHQVDFESRAWFTKNDCKIVCAVCLPDVSSSLPLRDAAFAPLVSEATYAMYLKAREEKVASDMQRKTWLEAEERMRKLKQEMAAMAKELKTAAERRVNEHRIHIVENILTLKCPRVHCAAAVFDFTGCFALTCDRCACAFCAWCLADCGSDAHEHVKGCPDNRHKGSYYGTFEDFAAVHREKRAEAIRAYIETVVDAPDKELLMAAIEADLSDLGITV